jgi:small subunit ribosomal protein S6
MSATFANFVQVILSDHLQITNPIRMKLRNYETVFVLTPVLTNEQIESTIQKFRNFLLEKGFQIVHEEAIGLKKLAYPIQHKNTGIYHMIEFEATPELVIDLEIAYRRDENIVRFLTCTLDKHGVEYNQKKREGALHSTNSKRVEVEPEFELNQEQIA